MFGSKKTLAQTGILNGFTDLHSHILPGVDDGIQSAEEALKILKAYEEFGVKKVVFTPHIMEEYPQNSPEFLRSRFDDFRRQYTGTIELALGAEYMLDNRFGAWLDAQDLLPVMEGFLLIETAFMSSPLNLAERLQEVRSKGYFVILAHPERYAYMRKEDYSRLKEAGVFFQLNLLSIVGGYGKGVEKKARELLHCGAYDFIGTDIHHFHHHMHALTHEKIGRREEDLLMRLNSKSFYNTSAVR